MCRLFDIYYASQIKKHLSVIDRRLHSLIQQSIMEQLSFQPDVITRNRKLVHPPAPFDASWEVRFGPGNRIRVFYDVNREECQVDVLAIGLKEGNRLIVAGEIVTDERS